MPLEILYTVVPLIMILGLFWFTARDQSEILERQHRPGADRRASSASTGTGASTTSTRAPTTVGTPNQPAELDLPVDERIRFELTSPDVIHSFWVPAFLFKMDVIPGKTNDFELTPDKVGTFAGKCAELCGVDHSRMLFNVQVVSGRSTTRTSRTSRPRARAALLDTGHEQRRRPDAR